jgi:hypothetical protein
MSKRCDSVPYRLPIWTIWAIAYILYRSQNSIVIILWHNKMMPSKEMFFF